MKYGVQSSGLAAAIALAWMAASDQAYATSPQDIAAAQKLYEQGRALVEKGSYGEACPKFEASQRLDPGIGTMFNLASCYENVGKTASAWAMFLEVARLAREAGEARKEQIAKERATTLEKTLSYVVVAVPEATAIPGLEVRRDGTLVDRPMWGTALPVDRGTHRVDATAPGKAAWSKSVDVSQAGATITVSIPTLEAEVAAGAPPVAAPPAKSTASSAPEPAEIPAASRTSSQPGAARTTSGGMGTQRWIGIGAGGLGVLSLGAAGLFSVQSKSKMDDSAAYCRGDDCLQAGVDLRDEALSKQTMAYVAGGLGGALLVTGAVLYFTAPAESDKEQEQGRSARERPSPTTVAVGPTGILLSGSW